MEVTTQADKKQTVTMGEMTGEVEAGTIAEMVTDSARLDNFVPGASAKGAAIALASRDETPEFPVLRVEEGWSNSHRLWNATEVESIVRQTNELQPVGHLGHIPDDQISTAFPPPQTTWFAATTKVEQSKQKERMGEMVTTAYFAGYNLPGAEIRKLIPAKAVRGISWWGNGDYVRVPGKGVEVRGFVLQALDWARKLSEGMPSSSVVAVTGEMEAPPMAKELSLVTPEEFKAENPNGYALLVAEATKDKDSTIGEMQTKVDEGEDAKTLLQTICEAIGVDPEKLLDKVNELKATVGTKAKASLDTALDKLLAEKVPDEEKRAVVRQLLPIGEMTTKIEGLSESADMDKVIGEMVDDAFDNTDTIKTVIGEMAAPVVRRRDDINRGADSLDGALGTYGMKRERVTLGS